jgi:hypothetical protein
MRCAPDSSKGEIVRKIAVLMAFAGLIFSAGAASACSVPMIRTFDNQTVDGMMTVRSGRNCDIQLTFSAGPTHSVRIVQRPSNGSLQIDGRNRVIYKSRTGFVGSDSFVYSRGGMDTRNNPVTRTVRINVRVTP